MKRLSALALTIFLASICASAQERTPNLALTNGTASASSVYPNGNYSPSSVTDGDRKGSGYGCCGGGWSDASRDIGEDWIEVRFNTSKMISSVVLAHVQNNTASPVEPDSETDCSVRGLKDFHLQYQDVFGGWITLKSVTNNTRCLNVLNFDPVRAQAARLLVPTGGWRELFSRLAEFEIFGEPF